MDNRLWPDLNLSRLRFEADNITETMDQRSKRSNGFGTTIGPPPERRSTISSMQGSYNFSNNSSSNRMRNLSGGSVCSTTSGSSSGSCSNLVDNQYSNNNITQFSLEAASFANTRTAAAGNMPAISNPSSARVFSSPSFSSSSPSSSGSSHHRNSRQERSGSFYSDNNNGSTNNLGNPTSSSQQSQRSVNSSRYKTELCRPFEESGSCKYGDKCQFAHGMHELRNLSRHPKYKTELCRTFHTIGYCPYGPRCHFIHEEEPASGKPLSSDSLTSPKLNRCGSLPSSSSGSSSPSLSPSGCSDNYSNTFCYQSEPRQDNRLFNALTVNINYNNGSSNLDALDRQFGLMNLNSSNDNGREQQGDIFSQVTMFSEKELLDNSPAFGSSSNAVSGFPFQSTGRQQLDNFPAFAETSPSSLFWHKTLCSEDLLSCMCPAGGRNSNHHHHSPTGSSTDSSSGSDSGSSGGSDCGGSTENLIGSGFSEWRRPVAIGQY
ncbi:mRNA decay activator protein zfp36 [Plakobranchus ocellatus]|uniref:mRNA decay activator protein zfp36 n=1 Tax=Plakobranchus ocellatus TaxID=259542 RepID=A0AAV4BDH8_9GAST|nr:mRNA decay activator protein zfp36 [Plakobranchus ocellatus]